MKKILLVGLILILSLGFVACESDNGNSPSTAATEIVIGATAVPHAEILNQAVRPILAEQGYELRIIEFDDFFIPNRALADGDIDLNFFQHRPFLNNFNEANGTALVPVAGVHFEPLRVYAGRLDSLDNIPQGAAISIPDDPSNEARALQLLEAIGLIELESGLGLNARAGNIVYNPHELNITPISAEQLPRTLDDVDFSVINGNFALAGGVIHRAIYGAGESTDSEAAINFTNYVVVREGEENEEIVRALVAAINSDAVRDFINNNYDGRVVPRF